LTGALSKHDFSEIPGLNTSLQKFAQNSFLNENSRNLRPNDRIQVSFLFQKESFETELRAKINYRLCEGVVSITGLHNSCNLKLQIFYPWLHDQHVPHAVMQDGKQILRWIKWHELKKGKED
jgi:hypothetical protein